jgi:hypothetical protein
MGHTHCLDLGYSKGRNWGRPNERKLHLGKTNFLEALLDGEKATATIENETPQQQPVVEFAKDGADRINALIEDELQARTNQDEEFRTELSDTEEEHLNAAGNKIIVEAIEAAKEVDSIPELNNEAVTIQQEQAPLAVEETDEQTHQVPDEQVAAEPVGVAQELEKTATPIAEDINIENKLDAEVQEPVASVLPPAVVEDDPVNQRTMVMYQRPPGRDEDTSQTVSRDAYKQTPYVQEFCISNWVASGETRTLPLPRLKYFDTRWDESIPSIGQWNMMHKKMVYGGDINHWACISLSRYVTVAMAPQLCNELLETCLTS